MALVFIRATLC